MAASTKSITFFDVLLNLAHDFSVSFIHFSQISLELTTDPTSNHHYRRLGLAMLTSDIIPKDTVQKLTAGHQKSPLQMLHMDKRE
jgi:hypothetical protein